jgi:hypothetical protein
MSRRNPTTSIRDLPLQQQIKLLEQQIAVLQARILESAAEARAAGAQPQNLRLMREVARLEENVAKLKKGQHNYRCSVSSFWGRNNRRDPNRDHDSQNNNVRPNQTATQELVAKMRLARV